MKSDSITKYLLTIAMVLVLINAFQIFSLNKKIDGLTGEAVLSAGSEKVTILEFSDFQCPYCSRGASVVEEVKQAYGDKVEVVFKHFPLDSIHPNARKAGEAYFTGFEFFVLRHRKTPCRTI